MENKEKRSDTSTFGADIDIVYINKKILTRDFIKFKTANILPLCLGVALSIGFFAVTYFNFVAEGLPSGRYFRFLLDCCFCLGQFFH